MTREETVRIIHIIVASYPSFKPSASEVSEMVETWNYMLDEYSYQVIAMALKSFITADTSGFPPSVGQLLDYVRKFKKQEEMNENQAWLLVTRAVSNSIYNSEEEFKKLPPTVQKAVGGAYNLREWASVNVDEFNTVISSHFMRNYRTELQREKEYAKLPQEVRAMIEQGGFEKIETKQDNSLPS